MEEVTLINGDGIGPEVMHAAKRCVEALIDVEWDEQLGGKSAEENVGEPLPQKTLESIDRTKTCLKGPLTTPIGTGYRSVNVALRKHFNLYANVRPVKYHDGVPTRISNPEDINITVVRENTEDLYAGIEFKQTCGEETLLLDFVKKHTGKELACDTGISLKPISRSASENVVEFAFQYAEKHGLENVVASDKANILKLSDGLFMKVAQEVADNHPGINYEHVLIDALCMKLVTRPEQFEVIVLPNLYGDIVSDLCAGLIGGLGFAPSGNFGDNHAVFEAVHGTAPDIAGKNIANPAAAILSAALMLRHLEYKKEADKLEHAVDTVIASGNHQTCDINHQDCVETDAFTDAVIAELT